MGIFLNPYKVLKEEAEMNSAEHFGDSQEVKDVVEDLADALENIPQIKGETIISNGQPVDSTDVKITAEMVNLIRHESAGVSGRRVKYLLEYSELRHFMEENEIEDPAEAVDQIAAANTDSAVMVPENPAEEPKPVDVEIQAADIVVVAPTQDEVKDLAAAAQQEAAHHFKGLAFRELAKLTKDLSNKNVNWRMRG